MHQTRTVIRVFLASPGDVPQEREVAASVIREANEVLAFHLGIILEVVRWEDMTPGMGRPEQVILDQARLDDVDVFIGVLWGRFGTPTGVADSGTEEEFDIAYDSWSKHKRPHIMFYFCERPHNFKSELETEQKAKVLKFRKRMESCGLVARFTELFGIDGFENRLRRDVYKLLLKTAGVVPATNRTVPAL